MLANPIMLIIAAIAALVAAFIYLWNTNEGFRQFWIDLWENIKNAVTVAVEAISQFLTTAWEFIKTTAVTVWTAISTFFTTIWEGIKNTVSTVVNAIKTTITNIFNAIKTTVTTIITAIHTTITTIFTNIWTSITTTVGNIKNAIVNGLTAAFNFIKSIPGQALQWGKDMIQGIVNGIRSMIGAVKDAVSSVASAIKSFLHFSVPDEGPLTDYESWMLHRLKEDQNADGSWNFSYDIYIGKLFHDYVRTGAIGWVVWGICYAILQMGTFCDEKHGFKKMLMKAGEWILSRQVTDTKDPRYGLLRGGYGAYDSEYKYSDVEIEWCSTEHQCSTLQALEGLSLVLNDKKYKEAAELVRDQLFLKCYDESNGRFYQGINGGKPDKAWALDCTTWAGSLIFSVVHTDTAKKCFHTARDVYLTENKQIIQSSDKEHYNMRYSSSEQFAGFKPYSDKTPDYEGAPDIVWTEGTLGYAALALCVGEEDEAKKYVDECIALQNCEGCTGGVIYVTETYASLPWEFHVWESVVSSAWLYLIINNPDVLFPRTLRQVYYMVKTYNIKDERP